MESPFKYIYQGEEVSKEKFTNVAKELFKWFDSNTINAVDYSSVSDFLDGEYKSKGEINNHLKGVLDGIKSNENLQKKIQTIWYGFDHTKDSSIDNRLTNLQDEFKKAIDNSVSDGDFQKRMNQKFAEAGEKAGEKHNKLKAPLDILQTRQFPKALQLLALATSYGNHKYKNTDSDFLNFKRVEGGSQTYLDASARHSTDRLGTDKESKLPHFIHAVWNQLAALQLWVEENELDIEEFSKDYMKHLQNQK